VPEAWEGYGRSGLRNISEEAEEHYHSPFKPTNSSIKILPRWFVSQPDLPYPSQAQSKKNKKSKKNLIN
jgi:hypothetical protein